MGDLRRIVFHIGLEKTGTTSVQASLHRNPATLTRHSVIYPSHNLAFGWENHRPLVGCYEIGEGRDRWLESDPLRRDATVASLIGEIDAASARTAVISAEHFSSRFQEPQIEALQADFARFDGRVVIVLRDHLSRLRSTYESYVTNGGAVTLDEYAEGSMRPGAFDLRYTDLVACWARVFGRDRIELVAYSPNVIRDVLSRIAPGLEFEPGLDTYRLRTSAGADVVAALRLANAVAAHRGSERKAGWLRDRQRRLQIRTWLQQSGPARPDKALLLDAERLQRLTAMANSDVARLEAEHGFVLKAPDIVPLAQGDDREQAAELLARALCAQAAKPWTKASLIGTGLAVATSLRDDVAMLMGKRRRLL